MSPWVEGTPIELLELFVTSLSLQLLLFLLEPHLRPLLDRKTAFSSIWLCWIQILRWFEVLAVILSNYHLTELRLHELSECLRLLPIQLQVLCDCQNMVYALFKLNLVANLLEVFLLLLASLTQPRCVSEEVVLIDWLTFIKGIIQVFWLLCHWHLEASLTLRMRLNLRLISAFLVEVPWG